MGRKQVENLMGKVEKANSKLQDLEYKVKVMLEGKVRGYEDVMVALTSLQENYVENMQCCDARLEMLERRSHRRERLEVTTAMLDKLDVFAKTMQCYDTRLASLERRSITDAEMVDAMPGLIFGQSGEVYQ